MRRAVLRPSETLGDVSANVRPEEDGTGRAQLTGAFRTPRWLRDLGRSDGMDALVAAWLPPMFAAAHVEDEALVSPLRQMCVEAGLAVFEAQIAALLGRPEVESMLPDIRCPTLVAVGREDRWSPPEQHEAIAAHLPHARSVVIEGAGHMLPAEAPDELNAEIARWLDQPARQ